MPTLSFYEYCELIGVDRPDIPIDLKVTSLLNKPQIERNQIMLQLSKVQNHFMRYLQVGGFPELALAEKICLEFRLLHFCICWVMLKSMVIYEKYKEDFKKTK